MRYFGEREGYNPPSKEFIRKEVQRYLEKMRSKKIDNSGFAVGVVNKFKKITTKPL